MFWREIIYVIKVLSASDKIKQIKNAKRIQNIAKRFQR